MFDIELRNLPMSLYAGDVNLAYSRHFVSPAARFRRGCVGDVAGRRDSVVTASRARLTTG